MEELKLKIDAEFYECVRRIDFIGEKIASSLPEKYANMTVEEFLVSGVHTPLANVRVTL